MDWWTASLYTLTTLLAIPTLPTVLFILINFRRTYRVPSHLPWAGLKNKTLFPRTRASLREAAAKRAPLNEGYERFSKHGKPFVLPAMHWPDVALPPSSNAWLIEQPDSVLSTVQTQDDLLALDYLGHGPDQAAVHDFSVITRDLTRQMGRLLPELREEVERSFGESFGMETGEWKEVELYEAIELAARRGASRIFVGKELCRDERVLERLLSAGITFSLCSAVIRTLVPSFLKSTLAPILGLPFFYQRWRVKRLMLPTIKQRMAAERQASEKPSAKADKPNDALQWIISSAYNTTSDTFALSPADIVGKTILLNLFAVFTTAITAGTVLLDILTHKPPSPPTLKSPADLLPNLRAEAAAILPLLPTDPIATRRMHKLDSVIRETLRFTPMLGRGVQRKVVSPQGVTTPDGLHLPKGTHVCAVVAAMQRDPDRLEGADEYRPLRWYVAGEGQKQQVPATQISQDFLSFSLGKHACPGRFFAVQTIKVMLAWVLLHYEFEIVYPEGKTEVEWLEIGEARIPPQGKKGRVRVRRRREGEVEVASEEGRGEGDGREG